MRVLTPSAAGQLPPNGIPLIYGNGGAVATYSKEITVTADGLVTENWFIPSDGTYKIYGFLKTISPSTAGTFQVDIIQAGGVGGITNFSNLLSITNDSEADESIAIDILQSNGVITIDQTTAGFVAPNAMVLLRLKAYLVA